MQRLLVCLVLIPLLGAGCVPIGNRSATTNQPNIILVITDDQRFDLFTAETMPTLYGLAQTGATFTKAHVTTPLCCPSRASMLTGEYAHNHEVFSNRAPSGGYTKFDDRETLPVWLHNAGYTTALVGKYLNDFTAKNGVSLPPGWDTFSAFAESQGEDANLYYNYSLLEYNNGQELGETTFGSAENDYSTDVLRDRALGFIKDHDTSKPFFLYFAPFGPHQPSTPAPRHVGDLAGRSLIENADLTSLNGRALNQAQVLPEAMAESLLSVDEAVQSFVDELKARDVLDNTIIIFMSDNGFHLGEHGLIGKSTPYEESLHVPLMVWDGRQQSAARLEQLVLNIDLAPTILDWAGIDIPSTVDGKSFVPLLRGEEVNWRKDFIAESWDDGPASPFTALHTGDYIYIEYGGAKGRALYDLVNDPNEETNHITDSGQAERIENAAGRLDELRTCAGTMCE